MKLGHAGAHVTHAGEHREHFWRHFLEMLGVMLVGMFAAGYILVRASGFSTWNDTIAAYPSLSLLVMAAGMSLPMLAWMLFRGMGRKELLRDGGGDDLARRAVPVARVVRDHEEPSVRGVLRGHGHRDAGPDALSQGRVLDVDVAPREENPMRFIHVYTMRPDAALDRR